MKLRKPDLLLQELVFFVIKHMPSAVGCLGHDSVFDMYEDQLSWLVYWWNNEEKVKEREYKKLRKKK